MIAIRLKGTGTKSRRKWRIVVADKARSRDSRPLEEIGSYNPLVHPPIVHLKKDRYEAWLKKGAKASLIVKTLAEGIKS